MAEQKDTLAELRRLAEASLAIPEPKWSGIQGWIEDGGHAAMARTHQTEDDEECDLADVDAAFIEAASPATVLKLLDVVEAAKRHLETWSDSGSLPGNVFNTDELEEALAALEGDEGRGGR